jgi:hypothetical protein
VPSRASSAVFARRRSIELAFTWISEHRFVKTKPFQLRNEILVRGDEILAELAKGWSLRASWNALAERKEITCGYKTFIAHVAVA